MMLGGLHIEIAAWSNIGGWLEHSGWTKVNITSAGTAQSFLNGTSCITHKACTPGNSFQPVHADAKSIQQIP